MPSPLNITLAILAAGRASRFGGRKLEAVIDGVMMGTMTGVAQGLIAHFTGDKKDLENAFVKVAKEAFFMAWTQHVQDMQHNRRKDAQSVPPKS